MSATLRMLDASANRAREALRVMEDVARFALDDASLAGQLKTMRHELRDALAQLPAGWIEAYRNVQGDIGKTISTSNERTRDSLADVAIAAGKRLSEALRTIEECAKLVNERTGSEVEQLRYRAYELEAKLALRVGPLRARQWGVCVLLTEQLCKRPWRDVLDAVIAGGVDAIQVREKEMQADDLCTRVRQVIERARPAGVSVIVNDRVDVALACGAEGVHLGTSDLAIADARRAAGRLLLIGASTHSLGEAERAVTAGADYCGVGMMFDSPTKLEHEPEGPGYLRQFVSRFPYMPHLAIGGITLQNAAELLRAGAQGLAISSAICAATEPDEVVRGFRKLLQHVDVPAGSA